jgi:hypothetical protein
MAVLTRLSLTNQLRFDLPDARALEANVQSDFQNLFKGFFSAGSYILAGFEVTNYTSIFSTSGVNISQNDVVLFHSEATTQADGFYVSAATEADAELTLSASTTNYIEADLEVETGTPNQRAKWDENTQSQYEETEDTLINLKLTISVNASGFTAGKIPLYKAVTNGSNQVTSLTDCRKLFFRLGTGGTSPDAANVFDFPSLPSSTYERTDTANPATSGSDPKPFQGGDKNIKTFKQWMDAVMTKLIELGGTDKWFELALGSVKGALRLHSTILAPNTAGAKFAWSGTALSITDSDGTPAAADNVGLIRRFSVAGDLNLRRADGQDGTSAISISDGHVMYVELPTSGGRNYSGSGSGSTNYKTVARDSFVVSDYNFWIAYREGTRLILRDGVELNRARMPKSATLLA